MTARPRRDDAWAEARLAIASFGGVLVLAVGSLLWGGYGADSEGSKLAGSVMRFGVIAAVVALVAVGVVAVARAIAAPARGRTGSRPPGYATAAAATLPPRRRVALASVFGALNLLLIAAGVLHILVWNPLARVPGLGLAEIAARMQAVGEGTTSGAMVVTWAAFWALATVLYVAACGVPRIAPILASRHIAVAGLLIIGGTCGFHWMAGFSMGMSLADTFATSGGDAALSGPLLALVGQACVVAALFLALVPSTPRTGPAPAVA
jgi:hypothetical protein